MSTPILIDDILHIPILHTYRILLRSSLGRWGIRGNSQLHRIWLQLLETLLRLYYGVSWESLDKRLTAVACNTAQMESFTHISERSPQRKTNLFFSIGGMGDGGGGGLWKSHLQFRRRRLIWE